MPPALTASQAYELMGEYDNARAMLEKLRLQTSDARGIEVRLQKINMDEQDAQGNYNEAVKIGEQFVEKMKSFNDANYAPTIQEFERRVQELRGKVR